MNTQTAAIALACLALSLAGTVAYVQKADQHPPTQSLQSPAPAPPAESAVALATESAGGAARNGAASGFSWRQIESEDYHQYIANLRAVGCPEQTIRDIVIADVNKLYAARENPLKAPPKSAPNQPVVETPEQKLERLRQLRTVQQEKRATVKELLGIDIPLDLLPSSGSRDYHAFEVAFRSLPEEKQDMVQSLQESYWQQADALSTKYGKKRNADYQTETRQLKDWLRQELTKVLTPQELEDYEIRTSSTAKQLSTSLASYFHPSEEEFRKIYRAKLSYETSLEQLNAQTAAPPVPDPAADPRTRAQQKAAQRQATEQARTAAMNQLNEQLKSTLGDDRYTEYQRSQDRTYDLLARLGMRYNLPQETVLQAYDAQKSFRPDPVPGADPAAAEASRAEMQRQLNERLTAILGDQAARGYRRVNGGTVPLR